MSKQQTAVEYLEKTVKAMIDNGGDSDLLAVLWHIQQAKEMEKEQIISTYKEGHYHLELDAFNPEQYYNETYGGNK